ncbi:uncharacterized protein [Phyllobates terribilis]|uniref:uncharacterized protein n=1 Tax=Phyllobates terribilis TaxID=111132 RepID=UPI003CCB2158
MRYVEIDHWGHPQHKLKMEYTEVPFKCDGCREVGIGSCYRCRLCEYDLHVLCALPYAPTLCHPFYSRCCFHFLSRPPGNAPRYCNACHKDVTGFLYHCRECGFDMHPCCAKLPLVLDEGNMRLCLQPKASSSCHRCGGKGRSWTYRSSCKKYSLHVACAKEMLVDNWHSFYLTTEGATTRIPALKGRCFRHTIGAANPKRKCCAVAALALQFVISAVLGDPTPLIVGLVTSLMQCPQSNLHHFDTLINKIYQTEVVTSYALKKECTKVSISSSNSTFLEEANKCVSISITQSMGERIPLIVQRIINLRVKIEETYREGDA